MPEIVVDSNVLVKWFVPEDYHEEAKALLRDHLHGRITAVAPRYALLEFANTLRKYVARRLIDADKINTIYRLLLESAPKLIEEREEIVGRALNYSMEKGVTVYDACYIVIAKELDTVVYTADERVLKQLEGKERTIRHIREYAKYDHHNAHSSESLECANKR